MVHICYGNPRHRIVLDCSRFYSRDEIFRISRDKHKGSQLSLEYETNFYQPIGCDIELRFACALVEQYCASFQSEEDLREHRAGLADAAHTALANAKWRQKPKTHSAVGVDCDHHEKETSKNNLRGLS